MVLGRCVHPMDRLQQQSHSLTTYSYFADSAWDVSGVTSMNNMACNSGFEAKVNGWNVLSVTDMYRAFMDAPSFTGVGLSGWDTARVTHMGDMFNTDPVEGSLTEDLSQWNVGRVTNFVGMFSYQKTWSSDLSDWDVSRLVVDHIYHVYKWFTMT